MADDPDLQIMKYDIKLYQHVIVLAPRTEEFGGDVRTKSTNKITFNQ